MTKNKRDSNRVGLVIDIRVTTDDKQEFILKSRNISDTGVFLEYEDDTIRMDIGEQVVLQVCGQLGSEDPPPVRAEVKRCTDEGIGLQFIL